MIDIKDFNINEAVLNVIDFENNNVYINDSKLKLTADVYEYIEKNIKKVFKDNKTRLHKFKEGYSPILEGIKEIKKSGIILGAEKLTKYLNNIMESCELYNSCDVLTALISAECGPLYVILKIAYDDNITHVIKQENEKTVIEISRLKNLSSKKVKCAAILKLYDDDVCDIWILDTEKNKKVDGKDESNYFTEKFCNASIIKDYKDYTFNLKYYFEMFIRNFVKDVNECIRMRDYINNYLMNNEEVEIYEFIDGLKCDPGLIDSLKMYIISKVPEHFKIDKEYIENKVNLDLVIENNIKLSIPGLWYDNEKRFVIKKNKDNTVDFIIKGISGYIEN